MMSKSLLLAMTCCILVCGFMSSAYAQSAATSQTQILYLPSQTPAGYPEQGTNNSVIASHATATWTGVYVGAEIGGGFGTTKRDFVKPNTSTGTGDVDGVIGGGTIGYDKQWGSIVTGLEGDISGTSISGTHPGITPTYSNDTSSDWIATLRPRVGYAFGRIMPYATGGVALGNVNVHTLLNSTGATANEYDLVRLGWTAGAGVEAALSSHWSVKGEYLFVDLANTPGLDTAGSQTLTHFSVNILRLGLNYRFH